VLLISLIIGTPLLRYFYDSLTFFTKSPDDACSVISASSVSGLLENCHKIQQRRRLVTIDIISEHI
jgi:hypothetical protein